MITKDALDNKLQHFHAFKCLFKAYVVLGTLENVYVVHKAIKIFIYTRHGTMNSKGKKKKVLQNEPVLSPPTNVQPYVTLSCSLQGPLQIWNLKISPSLSPPRETLQSFNLFIISISLKKKKKKKPNFPKHFKLLLHLYISLFFFKKHIFILSPFNA